MTQLKWENKGFGFLVAPVLGGLLELVIFGTDGGFTFWIQGAESHRVKSDTVHTSIETAQIAAYSAFEALMADQGFSVIEGEPRF